MCRRRLLATPGCGCRGRSRVGGGPLGGHRAGSRRGRPAAQPAGAVSHAGWAGRRRRSPGARERPSWPGWAAASALGLCVGVPETDHVVGVAAVLAVLCARFVRRARSCRLGARRRPRRRARLGRPPWDAGRRPGARRRAGHAGAARGRPGDPVRPRDEASDRSWRRVRSVPSSSGLQLVFAVARRPRRRRPATRSRSPRRGSLPSRPGWSSWPLAPVGIAAG